MDARRVRRSRGSAKGQTAADYTLSDPELRAYDRGLGTLRVDGVLRGHLASVVLKMTFPPNQLWPWFVLVWADGSKERSFEDYGPGWWTVRELDAGRLDHHGPSVTRRILGKWIVVNTPGPPCLFDFEWLPPAEAAMKWQELGLVDTDF